MDPKLKACFDRWEASFDALYVYLDTAAGVTGPVTASSATNELAIRSEGIVPASCSTECTAQAVTLSTTTSLLLEASGLSPSCASPATSATNGVVSTELASGNDAGELAVPAAADRNFDDEVTKGAASTAITSSPGSPHSGVSASACAFISTLSLSAAPTVRTCTEISDTQVWQPFCVQVRGTLAPVNRVCLDAFCLSDQVPTVQAIQSLSSSWHQEHMDCHTPWPPPYLYLSWCDSSEPRPLPWPSFADPLGGMHFTEPRPPLQASKETILSGLINRDNNPEVQRLYDSVTCCVHQYNFALSQWESTWRPEVEGECWLATAGMKPFDTSITAICSFRLQSVVFSGDGKWWSYCWFLYCIFEAYNYGGVQCHELGAAMSVCQESIGCSYWNLHFGAVKSFWTLVCGAWEILWLHSCGYHSVGCYWMVSDPVDERPNLESSSDHHDSVLACSHETVLISMWERQLSMFLLNYHVQLKITWDPGIGLTPSAYTQLVILSMVEVVSNGTGANQQPPWSPPDCHTKEDEGGWIRSFAIVGNMVLHKLGKLLPFPGSITINDTSSTCLLVQWKNLQNSLVSRQFLFQYCNTVLESLQGYENFQWTNGWSHQWECSEIATHLNSWVSYTALYCTTSLVVHICMLMYGNQRPAWGIISSACLNCNHSMCLWYALELWSPLVRMVYTYWLLHEQVSTGVDMLDMQQLKWFDISVFSGYNTLRLRHVTQSGFELIQWKIPWSLHWECSEIASVEFNNNLVPYVNKIIQANFIFLSHGAGAVVTVFATSFRPTTAYALLDTMKHNNSKRSSRTPILAFLGVLVVLSFELWNHFRSGGVQYTKLTWDPGGSTWHWWLTPCDPDAPFQGGRHMPVYRHKELRLSWDPSGAAAACGQGSMDVIAVATFFEQGSADHKFYHGFDQVGASDHYYPGDSFDRVPASHDYYSYLDETHPNFGYYRDSRQMNDHRLLWVPGGFSVILAWGQAEFQGGRDVRNLSYTHSYPGWSLGPPHGPSPGSNLLEQHATSTSEETTIRASKLDQDERRRLPLPPRLYSPFLFMLCSSL